MTTLARRNSSIHKIREYSLPKINLEEEYDVIHAMQEGWRGRLLLVEHKRTRHEVVLKTIHKESTSKLEFFREFHYNYYLSPHINILNAYDVAFQAGDYYIFAQEYAPFGDLTSNLSETGLGEANVKKIAPQIVSALEFMHSKDLVHRNINMDNILVFNIDFSEVKLCDFGATRKAKSLLKRKTISLPYAPPEVVDTVQNESFYASTKQDVWQLGVLLYILLTGALPWQKADITDPRYLEYVQWKKRKTLKTPKRFSNFTARALKMFKRLLEPNPDKRSNVREVYKYLEDKWLVRPMKRQESEIDNQSVCYSTYSIHSSKAEKDRVLFALKAHGIETTVDRIAKRKRIHEWIEKSLTNNYMFDECDNENENESSLLSKEYQKVKENVSDFNYIETESRSSESNFAVSSNVDKINQNNNQKPVNNSQNQVNRSVEQNFERSQLINSFLVDSKTYASKKSSDKQILNSANIHTKTVTSGTGRMSILSHNINRTPSLKEKSKLDFPTDTNRHSYKEMSSTRSHYYSPTRIDSNSPIRTLSRSQNLLNKNMDLNTPLSNENLIISSHRSRNQRKFHNSSKSTKPLKDERSKSLARDTANRTDIQKSKTHPRINSPTAVLTPQDSEDSASQSDDSLTSVIPVAYYH